MLRNLSFRAKDVCCGDSVECSQQQEFRDLNSDLYFLVRYCFSPLELNPFSAKNSVMESFSFAFSSGRSCSRVRAESPVAEAEMRRDLLASSEGQELIDPSRVLSDGFLSEARSVERFPSTLVSFLRVTSKLGFLFVDFPERNVSFSFYKKLLIN